MMRRALFIDAGKATQTLPLEGPAEDVRRLRRWFSNNAGGAWNDDEMITLSNPTIKQVRAMVEVLCIADYAVLTFSGHGHIEEDDLTGKRTQMITLKDGDIALNDLRPTTPRRVMICDACRVVYPVRKFTEDVFLSHKAIKLAREKATRADYRKAFELAVKNTPAGGYTMYGCRVGECCQDDPQQGGLFTSSLLDQAGEWYRGASPGILSVSRVLEMASRVVGSCSASSQYPQHPNGGPSNRSGGNDFPFGVSLP